MNPTEEGAVHLQSLLRVLASVRSLLILTHDNPDPDAIASAWALARLLRQLRRRERMDLPTRIDLAYGGRIGRTGNRAMVQLLRIPLRSADGIDLQAYEAHALVDAQPQTGNNSLPPEIVPRVVFDHHPTRPATRRTPFHDVRSTCGATATILYGYLRAACVSIDRAMATALYHAIRTDTQNLGRGASADDVQAVTQLFPLVDNRIISRIERARLPRSYFATVGRAIAATRLYGPVVVTSLGRVANPDVIAEFADMIMRVEGVTWAVCLGRYHKDLLISLRTSRTRAHAGRLMRRIVGKDGSGGGHGMSAGARVPLKRRPLKRHHAQHSADQVERRIIGRALKVLGVADERPIRMVSHRRT